MIQFTLIPTTILSYNHHNENILSLKVLFCWNSSMKTTIPIGIKRCQFVLPKGTIMRIYIHDFYILPPRKFHFPGNDIGITFFNAI